MWLALQGAGSLITFIGWFVDKKGPVKVGAYLMFFGGLSAFMRYDLIQMLSSSSYIDGECVTNCDDAVPCFSASVCWPT